MEDVTNHEMPQVPLHSAPLEEWCAAIGRTEKRLEVLGAEPLRRFALAIGADRDVEKTPPPLAHWAFFLPDPEDDTIGEDGHPRRGHFLPDIPLPRRMFAASSMEFVRPLVLGEDARLIARIADVRYKKGRSGDLAFATVERTIEQAASVCVRETQSFVYRGADAPAEMPEPAPSPPEGEAWEPSAVNLFRFSAATFNSHRIHYDLPYARDEEGYPALVVHGPFTAARLAAIAARKRPLARYSFRAVAPLYLGQPIYLRHSGEGTVEAVRCDGVTAMRAEFD